jgi:hypothetical protein
LSEGRNISPSCGPVAHNSRSKSRLVTTFAIFP